MSVRSRCDVAATPVADLIIMTCDDNLVFAHETLGRLWSREPWPANENFPCRTVAMRGRTRN